MQPHRFTVISWIATDCRTPLGTRTRAAQGIDVRYAVHTYKIQIKLVISIAAADKTKSTLTCLKKNTNSTAVKSPS